MLVDGRVSTLHPHRAPHRTFHSMMTDQMCKECLSRPKIVGTHHTHVDEEGMNDEVKRETSRKEGIHPNNAVYLYTTPVHIPGNAVALLLRAHR